MTKRWPKPDLRTVDIAGWCWLNGGMLRFLINGQNIWNKHEYEQTQCFHECLLHIMVPFMSCPLKSDPDCDDPDGRTLTNWSSTWANWKTCWPTAKARAERWEMPEPKGNFFEGNFIGYWLGDFSAGHGLGLLAYLRATGDNIQKWIKHDKAR